MKKTIIFLCLLLICAPSFSQKSKLPTQTVNGKTMSVYTVEAGDGWYSIARKFKITFAELKMANKSTEKLNVGTKLFIPAKLKSSDPYFEKNHTDTSKPKIDQGSQKVTHKVQKSENLFSISKKYNVTVDQIKQLNNLKSNSLKIGQVLVVSEKSTTPLRNENVLLNNPDIKPERQPENNVSDNKVEENKAERYVEEKAVKIEPKVKEESENHSIKEEKDSHSTKENPADDKKILFANGRQEMNESGVASWIDDETAGSNKYYALHRTAPTGTIIKITNKMNSRSVYVKVVGKLPDTGDNDGLIIKVSKSSAEKLGVLDQRFQASLLYGLNGNK